MSKYPVQYRSSSKGNIDIEDMATPHLMNAWRKLVSPNDIENASRQASTMRFHIHTELVSRGCTYDPETGRWTVPPKPEGAA